MSCGREDPYISGSQAMMLAQGVATVCLALTFVAARSFHRANSGIEYVLLSSLLGLFCTAMAALGCIFASHKLLR